MADPTTSIGFSPSTPAAAAGFQNAVPQSDGGTPLQRVSMEVPNTGGAAVQTANYTAAAADCGKLLVFNSASAVTLTLPAAIPFAQWQISVENIGAGVLTVSPNGLDLDGSSSSLTLAQNTGIGISTDGTNYFSVRGATAGGGAVSSLTTTGTSGAATLSGGVLNIPVYGGGGGGGALVLLEEHTASSSAELDFTASISSTYDDYLIKIVGLCAGTNGAEPLLQFSTNGGTSYDATAIYDWAQEVQQVGDASTSANGTANQSAMFLFLGMLNTATPGMAATLELFDPLNAANYKIVTTQGIAQYSGDSNRYTFTGGGIYRNATAVNAFRIIMSSGNIASGIVRCYGLTH